MNEIIFSHSEQETKDFMENLLKMKYLDVQYGNCDFCGKSYKGIFDVVNGRFKCLYCIAKEYFENKVGKREEFL